MEYNTSKTHLEMPEYGRIIQQLVERCKELESREERNEMAVAIVDFMGQRNPQLRDESNYKLSSNPASKVRVTDGFWLKRLDLNTEVTIPDVLEKCEDYGRVQNFAVAAGVQSGKFIGGASPVKESTVYNPSSMARAPSQEFWP